MRQEREIGLLAMCKGRQGHVSVGDVGGKEAGGSMLRGVLHLRKELYAANTPPMDISIASMYLF
jgi:hypothetical protein